MKVKFHQCKGLGEVYVCYYTPNNHTIAEAILYGTGKGNKKRIWINGLAVAENHRGKGFGKRLMQRVINMHGGENLYLHAYPYMNADNGGLTKRELVAFYKSFGFRVLRYSETNGTLMKRDAN